VASGQCQDTSTTRATAAWDDSPWVTAVGGSVPGLQPNGQRAGADPLWPSSAAGFSSVFARPAYQQGVASVTGSAMRSVPDITMDSRVGTSEAAPLFAGLLALATQLNHANVGPVNPALYGILGPAGAADGIADVIRGSDSWTAGGRNVAGFSARPGFDVASGWGTVDASRFVPSLVAATQAGHQEQAARSQAAAALRRLENGIELSPASTPAGTIPAGHTARADEGGLLPGHPVRFYLDGREVAVLPADASGQVSYLIDPSALKLRPGRHTLTLESMLLTATRTFTTA
jgi:hypothetical protein